MESLDLFSCDLGEIGALGVEPADEFVEILDCPFLPTGISMSAADLGPEDTADGFLIAELAAVVGQDVVNHCALFYTRSGYCAGLYEWSPAGSLSAYG